MKYNLPKPHLSYSQMQLWLKNKEQYRARYYEDGPSFENKETIFGKNVARMLEHGESDPVLDRLPKYPKMEHRILRKIKGVPFLGFFDSFDEKTCSILEYKTGKEAWTQLRVEKHDQLVIYSLLCKLEHKKVNKKVTLVWIETRYKPEKQKLGSFELEGESNELEFTGKIEIFERHVKEWERKRMKEMIVRVATEISEDYTRYLTKRKK